MKLATIKIFFCCVTTLVEYSDAYKILALLPFPIKSHYRVFDPLMIELARRGHDVTVVNAFPKSPAQRNSLPAGYKEISLHGCLRNDTFVFSIDAIVDMTDSIRLCVLEMSQYIDEDERLYASCPQIDQLLRSNDRYDLFLTELFVSDSFLPFVNKFGRIPWVGLCANILSPWTADRIDAVDNPSYLPTVFNNKLMNPKSPTFYQRLYNTYLYVMYKIAFYTVVQPKSQTVAEKYMAEYVDGSLSDIVKNASLILSFSHFLTNAPRAHSPMVKEIAGIHISEAKPLDRDIKTFIEDSEHGVIYFSMGSLLQTSTFPENKRDAFIRSFAKLPERVLWKWEGPFPNQTEKIKVLKWMPQRDILAHPNVKLFISHGGSLGINEAIYEGVPVLGIPIFADQRMNVIMMQLAGAADILDYKSITDEIVFDKLHSLLTDSRYAENAKKLSEQYKDRPMSAMDSAIYWIEYVVRHNGAHHLRPASIELTWYQYFLLDVILFVAIVITSISSLFYYCCKLITSYLCRQFRTRYYKIKQN